MRVSAKRGDTWSAEFVWTNESDGTVYDFTDYLDVRLQLRVAADDEEPVLAAAVSTGELTVDLELGKVSMEIPAASMAELDPISYVCDMEVEFQNGVIVSTETFKVSVPADITRA